MFVSEMTEDAADELRNSKIDSKILRWLNMSQTELATEFIFGHLNSYSQGTAIASDPDVSLDFDFLWLKTIQIETEVRKLWPVDESYLANNYPDYRVQEGVIENYYLNGGIISFFRVASANTPFTYSYQRRPATLVNTTDEPELPLEWHLLLLQKTKTKGYKYQRDATSIAASMAEEAKLLKSLGRSVNKRIDAPLVMGINKSNSGRPGRPTFPATGIPVP